MLLMVQWSPRSPTSTMSPLGAFTVTEHGAVPCEMVPSSQWESETGPPPELLIVKSNVVTTQPGESGGDSPVTRDGMESTPKPPSVRSGGPTRFNRSFRHDVTSPGRDDGPMTACAAAERDVM